MFKTIIAILLFCLVLFLYLHIQFHLKTSNDLELYEIDYPSKQKLEEICDLRQPLIFHLNNELVNVINSQYLRRYNSFEIKIRNLKSVEKENNLYVTLPLNTSMDLFEGDKSSMFITENNSDFLNDTGLVKIIKMNDTFLRPEMVSNCEYDILSGSCDSITPLRFNLNYRNYFLVTEGEVEVKLIPSKYSKNLYCDYDYENFEFKSPFNIWNIQPEYMSEFGKIKSLDINLNVGKIIYIPAYWWYTIKFKNSSFITSLKYRTYMNNLAILPHFSLHALQLLNIKQKPCKKIVSSNNDMNSVTINGINNDSLAQNNNKVNTVNQNQIEN